MSPLPPSPPPTDVPLAHLEAKARLLIYLLLALILAAGVFVLYARGAFDATQRLVLVADDSEGVHVGMDLTFSGFAIGRVREIQLAENGSVQILVDVAQKDAHWLRTSSVFTLVRGVVGSPNIRAYSGVLSDPPLPAGAVRTVLQGDASAEIPKAISAARSLMENLSEMTAAGGPVHQLLANLHTTTERLNGPGGALTVLMGSPQEARKVATTLDRTNALLDKLNRIAAQTDTQVYGPKGLMPQTQATVAQVQALLADLRTSVQRVDTILEDAKAISSNAKSASTDLGALREEVDANLRKIEHLVTEIQKKWPFASPAQLELP